MDNQTRKRIYDVLGALMRAQNPGFRELWENVFNDIMAPYAPYNKTDDNNVG